MKALAREFYIKLYTKESCRSCKADDWYFKQLSHRDRHWLNWSVGMEEVVESIKHMGALKALGPDGFPPYLFQKYWHIVGNKVTVAVQQMFLRGALPDHLNESIICLFLTGANPKTLNQFRPISLCNVLLKVVMKILVNCLKAVMPQLPGPFQSSFIAGRYTTDNIDVAQELIHSMC